MQQVMDDFELVQLQAQLQVQAQMPHSTDGTVLDWQELNKPPAGVHHTLVPHQAGPTVGPCA